MLSFLTTEPGGTAVPDCTPLRPLTDPDATSLVLLSQASPSPDPCLGSFSRTHPPHSTSESLTAPHPSYLDALITLLALPVLFAEEPGLALEVQEPDLARVLARYRDSGLHCLELGCTGDAGPHAMVREGGTAQRAG